MNIRTREAVTKNVGTKAKPVWVAEGPEPGKEEREDFVRIAAGVAIPLLMRQRSHPIHGESARSEIRAWIKSLRIFQNEEKQEA